MIILKKVEGIGASVLLHRCRTNEEMQEVMKREPAFYVTPEIEWNHAVSELRLPPSRTEIRLWSNRIPQ